MSGQLSLLASAGWKISTGQSAVMLGGWEVKAGTVHSLTCAIPERFREEFLMIKRYPNLWLWLLHFYSHEVFNIRRVTIQTKG